MTNSNYIPTSDNHLFQNNEYIIYFEYNNIIYVFRNTNRNENNNNNRNYTTTRHENLRINRNNNRINNYDNRIRNNNITNDYIRNY